MQPILIKSYKNYCTLDVPKGFYPQSNIAGINADAVLMIVSFIFISGTCRWKFSGKTQNFIFVEVAKIC